MHVVSTTAASNGAAAIAVEEITALLVSAQPSKPADSTAGKKRYHYALQLGKCSLPATATCSGWQTGSRAEQMQGLRSLRHGTDQ